MGSLEASKGGMKVGVIQDPLYKDSYCGITPPAFIPPLEPFDQWPLAYISTHSSGLITNNTILGLLVNLYIG